MKLKQPLFFQANHARCRCHAFSIVNVSGPHSP